MSQTIDSKVVEMRFDNQQFEQNVATSLGTLDRLKQSLKLEGTSKSLENVSTAVKNIDLSGIAAGVERLEQRFSTFGIVGMQVIQNLTNSAMNFAKNAVGGIWNTIITKGKTRAFNIENARFQLQGLFGDTKEGAAKVEEAMKNANTAVDGTAFGLDEAAKAASQFAASGVEVGEEMTNALLAISGTAAMTNSGFDDTARIFTTVAGNGRLMADQLNQLSSRGLNAAAALTTYFNDVNSGSVEASDSIKASIKEITKGAEISEKELREYVSKGLISFDLFATAMNSKFGEHAKKANDTVNGALSNVRAALGRIGAEFISPLIKQNGPIVKLLNTLRVKINDVKASIGPLAELFTTGVNNMATAAEKFISAFDVKGKFKAFNDALQGFVGKNQNTQKTIDMLHDLRDQLSGLKEGDKIPANLLSLMSQLGIGNVSSIKGTAGAVGEVASNLEDVRKIATEVIRGDWGDDWATRTKKLTEAGISEATISKAKEYVNALHKVTGGTWNLTEAAYAEADAQVGISTATGEAISGAKEWAKHIDGLTDNQLRAEGFTREEIKQLREQAKLINDGPIAQIDKMIENMSAGKSGIDLILESCTNTITAFRDIFGAIGTAVSEVFTPINSLQIYSVLTGINEFSQRLIPTEKTLKRVKNIFKGLFNAVGIVGDALFGIGQHVLPILGEAFGAVGDTIMRIGNSAGLFITRLRTFLRESGVFDKIGKSISKVLTPALNGLKWVLNKVALGFEKGFLKLGDSLPKIHNKFKNFVNAIKQTRIFQAAANSFDKFKTAAKNAFENIDWNHLREVVGGFFTGIWERAKGVWEQFKTTPVFSFLQEQYNNLISFVEGINWDDVFGSFTNFLNNLGKKTDEETGEVIEGSFNFENIVNSIKEKIKAAFEQLFGVIDLSKTDLLGSITGFFNTIFGWFQKDAEDSDPSGAVEAADTGIGSLFETISNGIGNGLNTLLDSISNLSIDKIFKILTGIARLRILWNMGNMFKGVGDTAKGIGDTAKNIAKTVNEVKNTLKAKQISDMSGALLNAAKALALALLAFTAAIWVLGSMDPAALQQGLIAVGTIAAIIAVLMIVWAYCKKMTAGGGKKSSVLDSFTSMLGGFLDGIKKAFSKFMTMAGIGIMAAGIAFAVMMIAKAIIDLGSMDINQLKQGLIAVGLMIAGLSLAMFALSKADVKAVDVGMWVAMAEGIKQFAAVVQTFGEMETGTLIKGLVSVMALLAAMTLSMRGISGRDSSLKVAANLLAMAVALKIITGIVKDLGGMGTKNVIQGVLAVVAVIGTLTLSMRAMAKDDGSFKTAVNLIAMAAALYVIAKAIAILAELDLAKMEVATVAIVGVIAALAFAMKAIDDTGSYKSALTIVAMAASLAIIAEAISVLGKMKTGRMLASTIAITGVMLALAASMKIINDTKVKPTAIIGILAMAVAMNLIARAITKLSGMKVSNIAASVIGISAMLLVLVGCIKLVESVSLTAVVGLVAMGAMVLFVAILGQVIKGIAALPVENVLATTLGLSALMLALVACVAILAAINPAGALSAVLALAVLVAGVSAIVLALGAIKQIPGVEWLVGEGAAFAQQLGAAIGGFIGAIAGGFGDAIAQRMPEWGTKLGAFATNASPFFNAIDGMGGSVESVKNLATAILALTAADLISGITEFVTGKTDFAGFGNKLSTLATSLITYAETIKDSVFADASIQPAIDASSRLAEFYATLATQKMPKAGGLLQRIGGTNIGLDDFGSQLAGLAKGLAQYVNEIDVSAFGSTDIGAKIEASEKLTEFYAQLAKGTMPKVGGIFQAFTGEVVEFDTFGDQLAGLAKGLAKYVNAIDATPFGSTDIGEKIEASEKLTEFYAHLASESMPRVGGVFQAFAGEVVDFETFGDQLAGLARGISAYVGALETTNLIGQDMTDKIDASENLTAFYAHLASESMPKVGGIFQAFAGETVDFGTFGTQLAGLAQGISQYVGALETTNLIGDDITDKIDASENLTAFYAHLANESMPTTGGLISWFLGDHQSLDGLGKELGGLATGIKDYTDVINTTDFNPLKMVASASLIGILGTLATELPTDKGLLGIIIGGGSGLDNFASDIEEVGKGLAKFAESVRGIKSDDVQGALDTAGALSALQEAIMGKTGKDGGLLGVFDASNLQTFSTGISELGTALNSFYQNIADFDPQEMIELVDTLSRLGQVFNASDDQDVSFDMQGFIDFCDQLNRLPEIDLTTFFSTLENSFAQAEAPVNALLTLVSTSIEEHSQEVVDATNTMMDDVVSAIENKADNFTKVAETDASAIATGLKSKDAEIKSAASKAMAATVTVVMSFYKNFKGAGSYLASGLSAGMKSVSTSSLTSAVLNAGSAVRGYYSNFYSAGTYLMSGLSAGIRAGQSGVVRAIASACSSAVSEAMRQFAINSPSKVFMKIGNSVDEGLAKGITDDTKRVTNSVSEMANSTVSGFSSAISKVSDVINTGMDFAPTIRPVLDLSELQNGVSQANSLFGERTMRLANVVADDMSIRDETSIGDSINEAVRTALSDMMTAAQEQGDLQPYVIEVPINIEGREVSRVTAPFIRSDLNRLDTRANRKVGIVGV